MSLFDKLNKSYSTPGKGVSKTGREKNAFFKFFEIYFSKFWQITKVNLYFNIVFIPVIVMVGALFVFMYGKNINWIYRCFVIFLPTILLGPVMTGITKVTRDFAREVPGFPKEDFKKTTFRYVWTSFFFSAVSYFLLWVIVLAVAMYASNRGSGWFYSIGYYVSIFVAAVFLFANYYIHIMVVTLELKKKDIIKNAVIFAFLCLPRNLILTLLYLFLTAIPIGLLYMGFLYGAEGICFPILVLYILFIYAGTMSFCGSFLTFPSLKKFIIDPYYEANPNETAQIVTNPEKVFKNIGEELKEKELPEYVYENGKLVHRSVIENAMAYNDQLPNEE